MASSVNFYADFKGLASLKKDATQQDPKALREAARQFESLFTQMMLKSMRDANKTFRAENSYTESDQTDFYREMFDNQMAVQMSKGKGLGLSDVLVRQLQGGVKPDAKQAAVDPKLDSGLKVEMRDAGSEMRQSVAQSVRVPGVRSTNDASPTSALVPRLRLAPANEVSATLNEKREPTISCGDVDAILDSQPVTDPSNLSRLFLKFSNPTFESAAPSDESPNITESESGASDLTLLASRIPRLEPNPPANAGTSNLATTREDFVRQLWPHAEAAAKELGVDAHMLIAQAALETGWGKSIPCDADGRCSFNLFGIKAGGRWQGPSVGVNTLEFDGGMAVRKRASFRAYDSPADSFRDYAALIKGSPRYAAAVGAGDNVSAFANALHNGGYATDPNYANKLTAVAERLRATLKTAPTQPLALGRSVSSGGET